MALTTFNDDLNIISKLADEPNLDDGLTAAELKAKFDEAGNRIKTYINGTLKNAVDGLADGSGLAPGAVSRDKLTQDVKDSLDRADYALIDTDGVVTPNNLADGAVTEDKIDDGAVSRDKLSDPVKASLDKAESALQTAPVTSVNGKTGEVSLTASDVGALPNADGAVTKDNLAFMEHPEEKGMESASVYAEYTESGGSFTCSESIGQLRAAIVADAPKHAVAVLHLSGGKSLATTNIRCTERTADGVVVTWQEGSSAHVIEHTPGGIAYRLVDLAGGGGGSSDYADLTNKPQINGVTLSGDKSAAEIGLATPSQIPTKTSDLTNDSGFITSAPEEVFWAMPGTTTYEQLNAAYQAKKVVLCDISGTVYRLTKRNAANSYEFSAVVGVLNDQYVNTFTVHNTTWGSPVAKKIPAVPEDVGAIAAPASPSAGQFLVYNGTAWVAQTLTTWQGGSY
jgi:hypothetical protein